MDKMEISALSLSYGERSVLRNITMGIKRDCVTALIGPSGCGKTTLLRTLNLMSDLSPECHISGTILLDGVDIRSAMTAESLRRQVGMVFQRPNPFPMSIYDNVAFGARAQGLRSRSELDSVVERSLRSAALWEEVCDRLKKPARALSGGQQQRLCIARALAVEPQVLLMDEPTSALDPTGTARVEQLIAALRGDYTVVVVTHNMQQAARIADNAAFMLDGELIEHGTASSIFNSPCDSRTRDYISGKIY